MRIETPPFVVETSSISPSQRAPVKWTASPPFVVRPRTELDDLGLSGAASNTFASAVAEMKKLRDGGEMGAARKKFELRIKTLAAADFRAQAEDVLKGLGLEHELLVEDVDEIRYAVTAPIDVRTKDVSDTLRLIGGGNVLIRWEEKKAI